VTPEERRIVDAATAKLLDDRYLVYGKHADGHYGPGGEAPFYLFDRETETLQTGGGLVPNCSYDNYHKALSDASFLNAMCRAASANRDT
jgi:hypothetical protein